MGYGEPLDIKTFTGQLLLPSLLLAILEKREAHTETMEWIIAGVACIVTLVIGFFPVSYTHLDVYKRQAQPASKAARTRSYIASSAAS